MRWSKICRTKQGGGWGILELNKINKADLNYHYFWKDILLIKNTSGNRGKSPTK
jgi:hypothetical protein